MVKECEGKKRQMKRNGEMEEGRVGGEGDINEDKERGGKTHNEIQREKERE